MLVPVTMTRSVWQLAAVEPGSQLSPGWSATLCANADPLLMTPKAMARTETVLRDDFRIVFPPERLVRFFADGPRDSGSIQRSPFQVQIAELKRRDVSAWRRCVLGCWRPRSHERYV